MLLYEESIHAERLSLPLRAMIKAGVGIEDTKEHIMDHIHGLKLGKRR
jgi:hypothetical protein